ncbi:FkbM family methyltransferase [Blastopirellula marina]|uniref:Methyltransferase FkbM domain-containing protein n=1 Tax=Blastopirellula marina TaxID=124 RepID=A0A2S8GNS8_9BACT|nr:FkbM family methyltransferase [Blastopirellula marina]PQO46080.1 hypothetical protein C5Y93_10920 [Blastopirellula marina]
MAIKSFEDIKQRAFYIRRCILGRDVWVRPKRHYRVRTFGAGDGSWVLRDDLLNSDSVVYSFGLGWDISFDLELIERHGCNVHGFELLPSALQDLEQRDLPPNFHLHSYGIGPEDRVERFQSENGGYASMNSSDSPQSFSFDAETRKLSTILETLGHKYIDVLKMDIEGAEFSLVDEICEHSESIGQLLIEWHQRMFPDGTSMLKEALEKLRRHFDLYYVSPRGFEHSYVSNRIAAKPVGNRSHAEPSPA